MLDAAAKFVAFDLEFIENESKIVCAATMTNDESVPNVWYEKDRDGTIQESLTSSTLQQFVSYLFALQASGYTVVTWGGVGSDFRVLATQLPALRTVLIEMCLNSVDVPFVSGTVLGMMMGLGTAAQSLGFAPKASSATIPELWKHRKFEVLQHVSTDTFMTVAVVRSTLIRNELSWVTQRGHTKTWCPVHLYTVRTCLQMPLPTVPFPLQDKMNPKVMSRWML